jgi:DNA polymerase-3 subunit gamma/tau
VLQAVPDAAARGVVDAPGDMLDRMRDQASRIGTATLTRYAEVVHAGLGEMRGATAPRLLLEVVCARLLLPSASDTESALLQRVERIENRLDMSIPVDPAPAAPTPATARAPGQAPPAEKPQPPAGDADAATAVRRQWTTVLEKVRERSRTLDVMLAGSVVRTVEGNTLVVAHQSAPLAKRLAEQRNAAVIEDALKDALGVDWRVRYEVGSGSVEPAKPQRDDEESMLAEASREAGVDAPRRDPEEAALELLENELGARRIDGP